MANALRRRVCDNQAPIIALLHQRIHYARYTCDRRMESKAPLLMHDRSVLVDEARDPSTNMMEGDIGFRSGASNVYGSCILFYTATHENAIPEGLSKNVVFQRCHGFYCGNQ